MDVCEKESLLEKLLCVRSWHHCCERDGTNCERDDTKTYTLAYCVRGKDAFEWILATPMPSTCFIIKTKFKCTQKFPWHCVFCMLCKQVVWMALLTATKCLFYMEDIIKCDVVWAHIRYGREQCDYVFFFVWTEKFCFYCLRRGIERILINNKAISTQKRNESNLTELDRANNNSPAQCNPAMSNDIDQFLMIVFCYVQYWRNRCFRSPRELKENRKLFVRGITQQSSTFKQLMACALIHLPWTTVTSANGSMWIICRMSRTTRMTTNKNVCSNLYFARTCAHHWNEIPSAHFILRGVSFPSNNNIGCVSLNENKMT